MCPTAYIFPFKNRRKKGSRGTQSLMAVVDWRNNRHCRAVAASLVQGAYNSEHNRQKSQDSKVQPSRWWSSFHFEVKRVLIDDKDSSIYGVVYEFKHPNNLPECAPKCVIAFRGTTLKSSSAKQDMKLNIKLLTAELRKDNSRFKPALDAVKKVVQEAEPANIWLAGHSLGSAIAMLVGKSMAQEEGKYLKTFLFNPPFLSPSLSRIINSPRLENAICSAKNFLKAGISFVGGDHLWQTRHDQFNKLSHWIPNLFVNKDDPICSRYIDHFENRKIEDEIHSIRSATKAAFVKDPQLPIYLLPKAYLTISKISSSPNISKICEAHGLKQWWHQMSIEPGSANPPMKVSIGDTKLVGEP
ncbi:hypothetical protein AAG906_007030 [Vitis piasezkii]